MSTEYDRTTVPEKFVRRYFERRRQKTMKDFPEDVINAIIYLATGVRSSSPTSTAIEELYGLTPGQLKIVQGQLATIRHRYRRVPKND